MPPGLVLKLVAGDHVAADGHHGGDQAGGADERAEKDGHQGFLVGQLAEDLSVQHRPVRVSILDQAAGSVQRPGMDH